MITKRLFFRTLCQVSTALFFAAGLTFAQRQPFASVSGRVLDDSTSAVLQNVNVFLAQTTLGCGTNENGQFEITKIPPGSYEIVASRVGYSVNSFRVTLVSGKREFEIRLKPSAIRFNEVVVSATEPADWKKQLEKFNKMFLGSTRNAAKCRILNPEVLDFSESVYDFTATARAPLEIENRALGYHLQFILTLFTTVAPGMSVYVHSGPQVLRYEGFPRMTPLEASSAEEAAQWNENRLRAYRGSMRHFLSSLVKMEVEKEGFEMALVPRVLGVPINRYDPSSPYFPPPQASEWNARREEVSAASLVSKTRNQDEWSLQYEGYLEVVYKLEPVERGYDLLLKRGTDAQASWLRLNVAPVTVNARGLIKEMWPTQVHGYWAWTRVADMLPLDFEPDQE